MSLIELKEVKQGVLSNLSLEIDGKGIFCFLGKDGSGKTTVAKMLAGVLSPEEGSVLYNGEDIYAKEKNNINAKMKIGYLPEKLFFDKDMNVFEHLDFVASSRKADGDMRYRQIKEALSLSGLSDRASVLIGDLSFSETKRLGFASTLLGNPEVLILDDPLRGMSADAASGMKEIIALAAKKKTVIIFTARPSEAEELSAHLGVLGGGGLALWRKTEEVLQKLKENGENGLSSLLDAFSEKKGKRK